jgi:hypothetical protein
MTTMTNIKLRNHITKTLSVFNPQPLAAMFSKAQRSPYAEFHTYDIYIEEGAVDDVQDTILKANPDFTVKNRVIVVTEGRQFIDVTPWHDDGCIVSVTGLNPRQKFGFSSIYD